MSGKLARDGIRADTGRRPVIAVLGSGFRLRITGTVTLAPSIERAREQRARIKRAVAEFAAALREDGVEVEFVVGQPRSPESLTATLMQLADTSYEEKEKVA